MPLRDVRTLEDHLGLVLFPSRVAAGALTLFGALGLLLSTLGIHGVVAHAVARRQREIGIRVALGASPDLVVRGILMPAARLALLGSSLGLLLALPAAGAVRGLVYTPRALDPVALVGVPLFLALVALAATWVPARRAARIDPASALKAP
jgi:ABC-type antimicrobial peptide transport system permease subunit